MVIETFRNPPIIEALIDIRVEPQEVVTVEQVDKLHEFIKDRYPKKEPLRNLQTTVALQKDGTASTTSTSDVAGYRFRSNDNTQVVQFRRDGFSFSRLRPYQNWGQLIQEGKRLWEFYNEKVNPNMITRLAVRYINAIEIPSNSFPLEDYFTSPLKIADGLPPSIESFFTRVIIQYIEDRAKAIITMATIGSKPLSTQILLDTDVFSEIKLNNSDYPKIWIILDRFREIKNDIFFKNLTEKTKELFR